MALFQLRIPSIALLFLLALPLQFAHAQGTVPTFQHAAGQASYTLAGADPAKGGMTTIPTVLVPIALSFDAKKTAGRPFVMDAGPDVARVSALARFLQVRLSLRRRHAVCRRHAPRHFSQGRRLAHAARQAGGEAGQDRRPRRLRLHPHIEEERRVRSPSWMWSSCRRSSSSNFRNSRASWSSPSRTTPPSTRWRRYRLLLLGNARRRFRHRKLLRARLVSP